MTEKYKDVNDNNIKFMGKTMANVECEDVKTKLELLITERNTNPLLGLDWMKKLRIELTLEIGENKTNKIAEDNDEREKQKKFEKLFNSNHTINQEATSWAYHPIDENEYEIPTVRHPIRN